MKKDDGYKDEPIGPLRIIKDFLPPPDQLSPQGGWRQSHHLS